MSDKECWVAILFRLRTSENWLLIFFVEQHTVARENSISKMIRTSFILRKVLLGLMGLNGSEWEF